MIPDICKRWCGDKIRFVNYLSIPEMGGEIITLLAEL
jgi:hypothetical protein